MGKKHSDESKDSDGEFTVNGNSRPARSRNGLRKGTAHSSSKRKRIRGARRKGNTTGGIHQRGDKKAVR